MSEEENIEKTSADEAASKENENVSEEAIQHITVNTQHNKEMEVHHPHHVTHKKKWGEYLLEFLMLFLAVFLGFVAENFREHSVEHERAQVLAQSIFEDLKKDIANLNTSIAYSNKKINTIDSLTALLHSPANTWDKVSLYKGVTIVFSTFPFAPTDGTYQQMKASGSLRYFDQSLVNLLNAYDNQLRSTIFRDVEEQKAAWEFVPFAATQINFEVTGDLRFNKPITHEMYIKMNDKTTIDIFINKVVTVRTMRGRSLEELQKQLKLARNLIETIKQEYHLENE